MSKTNKKKLTQSVKKSFKLLLNAFPVMIGVILLINLFSPIVQNYYFQFFTDNQLLDSFLGAVFGSISFGIPITSYIVGGELIKEGVSLLAVTTFIMAWTTVGLAMLPLEIDNLGRRFAILRNGINFVFSIVIAFLTVYILSFFG